MSEETCVRPVQPGDIDTIIRMVRAQEFAREQSAENLRRLFEYSWTAEKPNLGLVVSSGSRVVGYLGAIYSDRVIGGQTHHVCNMCVWYVEPEFRGWSLRLPLSLISLKGYTFTNLTVPARHTSLFEKMGFEAISRRLVVFRLGLQIHRLLRRSPEVLEDPDQIEPILSGEHLRIFRDHLPYDCSHYLVRDADDYCYAVTKRRSIRRSVILGDWPLERVRADYFPRSDILFLSNPEIAVRHWDSLKWAMLRRDRAIAVTGEECILGPVASLGKLAIPHPVYVYRRGVQSFPTDALYSELVLLPI